MAVSELLNTLHGELSANAKVLVDPTNDEFKVALQRWSDTDKKVPGAIVLVASEEDIVKIVNLAIKYDVPFVPKSGGHSVWSTIGSDGIIIDLSNYTGVKIDKATNTVQVQAGVLNQQLIEAAYEEGLCVPLGSGNTIGVIAQAIGGGLNALMKICGTTSDNIVSARLITATGELVTVDSSKPDLLWALKGAGQFFGLVIELTLQAYPLSILGTNDGTIWSGAFMLDITKAGEVAKVAEKLMNDKEHNSASLCIITTNPHTGTPFVMLMAQYLGPSVEADQYFAPIKDLGTLMTMGGMIKVTEINNGMDPFCVKGGYKRLDLHGVPKFDPEPWQGIAEKYIELTKSCSDAKACGFAFELVSGDLKQKFPDSAWAHRDVKTWIEILSWYTDPASETIVEKYVQEATAAATEKFKGEEIHSYQNWSRNSSLESRYGKERLEKLRSLKRKWDPKGVFTKQLL